jgi:hypothetical protein
MNIRTKYDPPPIPIRDCDWSAWDDDTYDYDGPLGWGKSEGDAMYDLGDQMIALGQLPPEADIVMFAAWSAYDKNWAAAHNQ